MDRTDALVVLVTVPSPAEGQRVGKALVEERLAACVNLLPGIRSIYRWEGRVEEDEEALLVIKAPAGGFAALEERIRELHPYDVPEVLGLPVAAGSRPYLAWLAEVTGT